MHRSSVRRDLFSFRATGAAGSPHPRSNRGKWDARERRRFSFSPQTPCTFISSAATPPLPPPRPAGSQMTLVKWIEFCHVTVNDEGWSWEASRTSASQTTQSRVLANWSHGSCFRCQRPLTSPIVLQRRQYFHKLWKDNLVLDSQYWVISRDPLLAMYYSRVFKPHSGPGRKCSLPVSVTGYQPLIYYSTCWSKATQSNSLWCCRDRRGECGTAEAARRPPVISLLPEGRMEGVAARPRWTAAGFYGVWKSPGFANFGDWANHS